MLSERTEQGNTMSPIFNSPVNSALGMSSTFHRASAAFFAISLRFSGLRISALANPPRDFPFRRSSMMLAPFFKNCLHLIM